MIYTDKFNLLGRFDNQFCWERDGEKKRENVKTQTF